MSLGKAKSTKVALAILDLILLADDTLDHFGGSGGRGGGRGGGGGLNARQVPGEEPHVVRPQHRHERAHDNDCKRLPGTTMTVRMTDGRKEAAVGPAAKFRRLRNGNSP